MSSIEPFIGNTSYKLLFNINYVNFFLDDCPGQKQN